MKKDVVFIIAAILLASCAYAADSGTAPSTSAPTVTQIVGDKTDAKLGPATYPLFTNFANSSDSKCQEYLEKNYTEGGLSLAPICQKSKFGNGYTSGKCNDFLPIDELVFKDFRINKNYSRTAKLLITWTVRIEGYSKDYSINPELCRDWYGTLTTKFPSGEVKTALYINGIKVGNEVILQVPEGQDIVNKEVRPPSGGGFDPTLVGTYVLTADDFPDKMIPEKIGLMEIRWKNETSMDIVSPKGMRNMIINMLPVSK